MSGKVLIISKSELPGTNLSSVVIGMPDFTQATITVPTSIIGTDSFDAMALHMIAGMAARTDALSGGE